MIKSIVKKMDFSKLYKDRHHFLNEIYMIFFTKIFFKYIFY